MKFSTKRLPNFLFEVAVIIIGILLSLLISNWVQGRQDHQKELIYLKQIKADLEVDLKRLNSDLDIRGDQLRYVYGTLQQLNSGVGEIDEVKFVQGIRQLVSTLSFTPNNVTFRSLESTGQLNLLDNQAIIQGLVELYVNHYAYLKVNNDDVTNYRNNLLLPYLIQHADLNAAVLQLDHTATLDMLKDPVFRNHLVYNQISIFSTQGAYKGVIEKVEHLLVLVEAELG